jgi:hypothetical protein
MTEPADPYLEALDDLAAIVARRLQAGPGLPVMHRGPLLAQLGEIENAILDLRSRRRAARSQGTDPCAPPEQLLTDDQIAAALGTRR